jgi:hypothetical protein
VSNTLPKEMSSFVSWARCFINSFPRLWPPQTCPAGRASYTSLLSSRGCMHEFQALCSNLQYTFKMIWSWTLSLLVVLIFLSSSASPGLLLLTCFCRRLLVLVCLSLPSRPPDVHVLTKTLSLVFACLLSPVCPHLIVLDSFS